MILKNKKGFTLIELVVVIFVIVIVFGLVAGMVGFSTRFFRDENTQVMSQESLRLIAVDFEKDIRRSTGFERIDDNNFLVKEVSSGLDVTYTLTNDFRVLRNGALIGERIQVFDPSIEDEGSSILLTIESRPDGRNKVNQIEFRIYIRGGD